MGTSQGPGAPPWEVLAPKAGSCGRWEGARLEAENLGFQEPGLPCPSLGPWQLTRSCVWAAGADGSLCVWGRKGGGKPPPPSRCLRILDVGEAAGPSSLTAAACLSPWQPGQKTNLPGSGFCRLPWSWVLTCLSGSLFTATPRSLRQHPSPLHWVGGTRGQPENTPPCP